MRSERQECADRIRPLRVSRGVWLGAGVLLQVVACFANTPTVFDLNSRDGAALAALTQSVLGLRQYRCGFLHPIDIVIGRQLDNSNYQFGSPLAIFDDGSQSPLGAGCHPVTGTASGDSLTFEYHSNGLFREIRRTGTVNMTAINTFNLDGLIAYQSRTCPALAGSSEQYRFGYDWLNNITSLNFDIPGGCSQSSSPGIAATITVGYADVLSGRNLSITAQGVTLTKAYSFTASGQLQRLTESCDALGQIICDTGPYAARTTDYTYDSGGRMTSTSRSDGASVTYSYDGQGRFTGATTGSDTVTAAYDAEGRMTSYSNTHGPVALTFSY